MCSRPPPLCLTATCLHTGSDGLLDYQASSTSSDRLGVWDGFKQHISLHLMISSVYVHLLLASEELNCTLKPFNPNISQKTFDQLRSSRCQYHVCIFMVVCSQVPQPTLLSSQLENLTSWCATLQSIWHVKRSTNYPIRLFSDSIYPMQLQIANGDLVYLRKTSKAADILAEDVKTCLYINALLWWISKSPDILAVGAQTS